MFRSASTSDVLVTTLAGQRKKVPIDDADRALEDHLLGNFAFFPFSGETADDWNVFERRMIADPYQTTYIESSCVSSRTNKEEGSKGKNRTEPHAECCFI